MEVCSSCACEQFLIQFFNSMLMLMSRTWQGQLMLMSRMRQGQPMVSSDNGPNGGTPSLGISIDLSSLFRPPTRPANPPLSSTFTLAGDPFMQPVGTKKNLTS